MLTRIPFRTLVSGAAALLVAAATAAAPAQEQTWEAHVTDEMCGSSHMMEGMTDPECARACEEMGAAYLLYVAADDKLFKIADQERVEEFAGSDVLVTGVLSDDGETVTIREISLR